jgi:hypothetical protein
MARLGRRQRYSALAKVYLAYALVLFVLLRFPLTRVIVFTLSLVFSLLSLATVGPLTIPFVVFGRPSKNAFRAMWKIDAHRDEPSFLLYFTRKNVVRAYREGLFPPFSIGQWVRAQLTCMLIAAGVSIYYRTFLGLPIVLFFCASACLWPVVGKGMPPAVLYLACSGPHSIDFVSRFEKNFRNVAGFHRCVSLIRKPSDKYSGTFDVASLRLVEDEFDWKAAVRMLVLIAPMIVVDLRATSEHLAFELSLLQQLDVWKKTFILIGEKQEVGGKYPEAKQARLVTVDQFMEQFRAVVAPPRPSAEFRFGEPSINE